jgi:prepilin-type N-terminal cleavage/methylation domain-containing protein
MKEKLNNGFTLLELVITISIIGILAAVVTPTYIQKQAQAKIVVSQSNMVAIRQAFINNFYQEVLEGNEGVFPPEPDDNQMTSEWSSTTVLSTGKTVDQLFSEGKLPKNSNGVAFLYTLLEGSEVVEAGFQIDDPDSDLSLEFRP